MKSPKQWISKLVTLIALSTFTSSAFAAGGTVTFTSMQAIPTLSGTMLIVLSLLLFVVAVKVSRQKGNNAGKFFLLLIGAGALVSGTGGVKLLSDVHAGSTSALPLVVGQPYIVNRNDEAVYHNTGGQALNFDILADGPSDPSICGYEIFASEPMLPGPPMLANPAAEMHSGELPAGQYLLVRCMSSSYTNGEG